MRIAIFCTVLLAACGSKEETEKEARGKASDLADKVSEQRAKASGQLRDIARSAETRWDDGIDKTNAAIDALRPHASSAKDGAEALVVSGTQKTKEVAAMAKAAAPRLADGIGFKPIYQKADDPAALDAVIGDMPHSEVIDGITVGFKPNSKRQYLVLWRQGDHLVGFVYTSLTDILIAEVIENAPALVALVRTVI